MTEVVHDDDSYKMCNCSSQIVTTNKRTPVTGQMPSCRPTNSVKALKAKSITFHGLAHPKLTWGLLTLSLTTKDSWLP